MYRRMMALKKQYRVNVVFWDRCLDVRTPYSIPVGIDSHRVMLSAPQGRWSRRIIPLLRFGCKALKLLRKSKPDVIHCANLDMLLVEDKVFDSVY